MTDQDRLSGGANRSARPTFQSAKTYLTSLAIQTIAASTIIAAFHSAFRIVADDLGVLHSIPRAALVPLIGAMAVSQAAYWHRIARVAIPAWHHVLLGHCCGFASRLSFIFGGAMFSLFFLRHAPGLIALETGIPLLVRIAIMLAALFCLYCYALELDRFGNVLQSPRAAVGREHPR